MASFAAVSPKVLRSLLVCSLLASGSAGAAQDRFAAAASDADAERATGIYLIGRAYLPREPIEVYGLLHNGEVLQVHARVQGRWLAKRLGSSGGKDLTPSRFDELMAIAGGADRDVRRLGTKAHAHFNRVGELLPAPVGALERSGQTARFGGRRPSLAPALAIVATARASGCGPIGCGELYRLETPDGRGYAIRVALDRSTWGFEGYGIVAVWGVPSR